MLAFGKKALSLTTCAARYWSSDDGSTTGAALAFFCAFSLAPLLVILLTIAGWIVGATAAYSELSMQLNALLGPATRGVTGQQFDCQSTK